MSGNRGLDTKKWYIFKMKYYYSDLKKRETLSFTTMQMGQKDIMLSEISQA
jgi:hypothetical protein